MINETGKNHTLNLDLNFFNTLKFDSDSLREYRVDAAIRCADTLGPKPALCLSGGIDSQAMVQCWHEAELDFDIVICAFNDKLNYHDSDHAIKFCDMHNLKFKVLDINIVQLLGRDNYSISEKYKSISPHFNVHYRIVELLASMGYSGACFGGVTPFKRNGQWGDNFSGAPFHFLKIQNTLPIPMQGSFLSFSPELTWAIGLQTPDVDHDTSRYIEPTEQGTIDLLNAMRYKSKLIGYASTGLDMLPQETKYTGFEHVKKYYEKKYNDGWAFERKFRFPISKLYGKDPHSYKFSMSEELKQAITLLHNERAASSL